MRYKIMTLILFLSNLTCGNFKNTKNSTSEEEGLILYSEDERVSFFENGNFPSDTCPVVECKTLENMTLLQLEADRQACHSEGGIVNDSSTKIKFGDICPLQCPLEIFCTKEYKRKKIERDVIFDENGSKICMVDSKIVDYKFCSDIVPPPKK